jgi:hypothetical protein
VFWLFLLSLWPSPGLNAIKAAIWAAIIVAIARATDFFGLLFAKF